MKPGDLVWYHHRGKDVPARYVRLTDRGRRHVIQVHVVGLPGPKLVELTVRQVRLQDPAAVPPPSTTPPWEDDSVDWPGSGTFDVHRSVD